MKRILLLVCFTTFIFLLVSCNKNENSEQNAELLTGMPKHIDDNRYNPTLITIGEKVQNFVLTEIHVTAATEDYPIDTVTAKFEANEVLTGDLQFIKADNHFYFDDKLIFLPDLDSQLKLPISHHEDEVSPIVFINQDEAITLLKISPGEQQQNINLKIEQFTDNFLPTGSLDTAILVNVIN